MMWNLQIEWDLLLSQDDTVDNPTQTESFTNTTHAPNASVKHIYGSNIIIDEGSKLLKYHPSKHSK